MVCVAAHPTQQQNIDHRRSHEAASTTNNPKKKILPADREEERERERKRERERERERQTDRERQRERDEQSRHHMITCRHTVKSNKTGSLSSEGGQWGYPVEPKQDAKKGVDLTHDVLAILPRNK